VGVIRPFGIVPDDIVHDIRWFEFLPEIFNIVPDDPSRVRLGRMGSNLGVKFIN
jgi:hypothetical protein